MQNLVRTLFLFALVLWVGTVLFLSFAVAPTLFRAFPVAEAGRVMSALFPVYYGIGYVAGAILLVTAIVLRRTASSRGRWTIVALVVGGMLAATVYAGAVVQPRVEALRGQLQDAHIAVAARAEFDGLHRQAVQLNSVVVVGGILILIVTAARLRP